MPQIPENDDELNEKQALFIKEYLVDLNGAAAAIRAGYSEKTARSIASKMLTKLHIQKALLEAMKKRANKVELNADYVLQSLIELSERCMQRKPVMDFNYETKQLEQRTEIVDGQVVGVWQFDSQGANKALRSLGDHLGLFKKILSGDPDAPLFPNINITRAVKPPNTSKDS